MDMLDKLKEYLDNATQEELQETYNKLSHLLCKNNSTIVERAVNVQHEFTPNRDWGDVAYGYERGATEQKAIDEELMLKMDGYKQGFYDGFVEGLIAVKKELRKADADDLYDYKNAIITLETNQKDIVKNLLKQLEE